MNFHLTFFLLEKIVIFYVTITEDKDVRKIIQNEMEEILNVLNKFKEILKSSKEKMYADNP